MSTTIEAPEVTDAAASEPEPRRTATPDPGDTPVGSRRSLRAIRTDDVYPVIGAAAGAMATATLLFGWIAPLTGMVGWLAVSFVLFIVFYGLLVSVVADLREVIDRVMTVLLASAGIILFSALVFVVVFVILRGADALFHWNFFVQDMQFAGPLDGLDVGGVSHAIMGTLIQIGIALAITVPLGILTAVFLNEIGGPFARFVRTVTDAMTALPSIVAGLFVYSAIILLITGQRSGFAAAMAITVMMLPIVVRAADVVLRLVAGNLREAALALGASRFRTVWHVVLPTARSGLATAVILGTARGIGETSPVLLTSGVTAVMNLNPFEGPMISLPLQVFDFVRSPEPNMVARGFGAAAVLMLLVLALFAIARIIGGRGPGELTARQRSAVARQSQNDLIRIERAAHARTAELAAPAAPPAHTAPPAAAAPPVPQEES